MLNKIPRIYLAAVVFVLVIAFFVYARIQQNEHRKNQKKFDIPYQRFAGAETLSNARSKALIAEINHLIEQKGLPADVFFGLSSKLSEEERQRLQELQENNIALTLHSVFHEYYEPDPSDPQKPLRDDLHKLWEASPLGEWNVDETKLESVKETLTKFEQGRKTVRNKLEQTNTLFYYIFDRPDALNRQDDRDDPEQTKTFLYYVFSRPGAQNTSRYMETTVNTEASRYLADYALLEEYAAAQALLEGNIESAIDALAYIFRITYLASTLENVGARLDATVVRLRTFDVMQRIILDPKFERTHLMTLRNRLLDERNHWTPEYAAWFGDRASGMMLYHRIVMNGLENAVEPADFAWMEQRGVVEMFNQRHRDYQETDKVFYLRSMQKILDICDEPFVRRLDVLNQIYNDLLATENTFDEEGNAREHFVAHIMLKDVNHLMRFFAEDESALNRALAAMSESLGQRTADRYRDPFTDEPYEVQRTGDMISVPARRLPRPFQVPVFASP